MSTFFYGRPLLRFKKYYNFIKSLQVNSVGSFLGKSLISSIPNPEHKLVIDDSPLCTGYRRPHCAWGQFGEPLSGRGQAGVAGAT